MLRGEAGIGKTALLDYAVERAEGMSVVRALGVESEAQLEFSALLEVCWPLRDHLEEIAGHQAEALRAALGLGSAEGHDRFSVGAATLSLLAAATVMSRLSTSRLVAASRGRPVNESDSTPGESKVRSSPSRAA